MFCLFLKYQDVGNDLRLREKLFIVLVLTNFMLLKNTKIVMIQTQVLQNATTDEYMLIDVKHTLGCVQSIIVLTSWQKEGFIFKIVLFGCQFKDNNFRPNLISVMIFHLIPEKRNYFFSISNISCIEHLWYSKLGQIVCKFGFMYHVLFLFFCFLATTTQKIHPTQN